MEEALNSEKARGSAGSRMIDGLQLASHTVLVRLAPAGGEDAGEEAAVGGGEEGGGDDAGAGGAGTGGTAAVAVGGKSEEEGVRSLPATTSTVEAAPTSTDGNGQARKSKSRKGRAPDVVGNEGAAGESLSAVSTTSNAATTNTAGAAAIWEGGRCR